MLRELLTKENEVMRISPYVRDKASKIPDGVIEEGGPAFFVSDPDRNLTEVVLLRALQEIEGRAGELARILSRQGQAREG